MEKKFKNIFLDLDGTVLEERHRHFNCYHDTIIEDGGISLTEDEYWEAKRNKIDRNTILERSSYPKDYQLFLNKWLNRIEMKKYLEYETLKPKALETLKTWRTISEQIVIVTMREKPRNLMWQVKSLGILPLVDKILRCSPKNEKSKIEALNCIDTNMSVFIGDTEVDMQTARSLGIIAIAVIKGLRAKQYLDADYYFEEIKDIDFRKIDKK
jgi:phosphoglycolate phosphatase-like HAD superfamily hydrolase